MFLKAILCAVSAAAIGVTSLILNLTVSDEVVSAPISWGLGHHGNETVPTVPGGSEELLKKYDGMFRWDTNEKKVYFTFDLGYEAGYTGEVLDILDKNGIKATFFLCGNYLQNADLINRMIAGGHNIGNHTDKHKDLPTLSDDGIRTDIGTFQKDYLAAFPGAKVPVYFRPPQGRIDERTLKIAKGEGLKTVMWSVAIRDWAKTPIEAKPNAEKIASRVHPGAIILMHITNAGTPRMIEELLPLIAEKGYTVECLPRN